MSDGDLYVQLAQWRDHVDGLLRVQQVPIVTVEMLQAPGAIMVKVSAKESVTRLVEWADPTLALISPPDDERPFFSVALIGGPERDVVMFCGEPTLEDEAYSDEAESDTVDWGPILARVDEALEELVGSDAWHFGTAATDDYADAGRVLEYAFPEEDTDETTNALVQDSGRLRAAILDKVNDARLRQKNRHLDYLFENPDQIADKLLKGPNGPQLIRLTPTERLPLVQRILKREDPCVTRDSCRAVARAIGTRPLRP